MNGRSHHEIQMRLNATSMDRWESFANHREHVTQLILASCGETLQSLCVLGAGNGNDLDLPALAARFSRIVLADLDIAAMQAGIRRQFPMGVPESLELCEADVTGSLDLMNELQHLEPLPREQRLPELSERFAHVFLAETWRERFDCVVSTCLLSQLIAGVKATVGESHPQFVPLVQKIRRQHMRTLAELTKPGGVAILITDFVSSLTVPNLLEIPEQELPNLIPQLVAQKNFFTGLAPKIVENSLSEAAITPNWAAPPIRIAPWVWNLSPQAYLVMACVCPRART